jgi:hypothetical protein
MRRRGYTATAGWLRKRRAAGFSPSSVPGLAVWLESSAGLFADAAETTPATSAAQAWADGTANRYDVKQASAPSAPAVTAGVFGTLPGVTFGSGSFLSVSGATLAAGSADSWAFCVFKAPSDVSGSDQEIWMHDLTASGIQFYAGMHLNNGAFAVDMAVAWHAYSAGGGDVTPGGKYLGAFVYSGHTLSTYLNGAAGLTYAGVSQPGANPSTLYVGSHNGGQSFAGSVGALLYGSGAISPSDFTSVTNYLTSKYSI